MTLIVFVFSASFDFSNMFIAFSLLCFLSNIRRNTSKSLASATMFLKRARARAQLLCVQRASIFQKCSSHPRLFSFLSNIQRNTGKSLVWATMFLKRARARCKRARARKTCCFCVFSEPRSFTNVRHILVFVCVLSNIQRNTGKSLQQLCS